MTPTCSTVSGRLSEEGTPQDRRTEPERRTFQGGGGLGLPHTGGVDRKGCPPGTGSSLEEEFPKRQRLALPKELLHPLRFYLCVSPPRMKWGLPPTFLMRTDTEFWCRKARGVTSSSLQPTTQRQLCTLHGRTVPRTEQTIWAALMTRKFFSSSGGDSLSCSTTLSFGPGSTLRSGGLPSFHTRGLVGCRKEFGLYFK